MNQNKKHAAKVIILLSLILLCCSQSRVSFAGDLETRTYPSFNNVKAYQLDAPLIDLQEISLKKINHNFSNIDDLGWLKSAFQNNKVIFVGENHYGEALYDLANRILFAANTWDSYSLFLFEDQYSTTPFINYYVHIQNNREARVFYNSTLHHLLVMKEDKARFELIRVWNKNHPNRQIDVGFHDLEHDFVKTLKRIVIPYFQLIDPALKLDQEFDQQKLEALLPRLRLLLKQAKNEHLQGSYPFITTDYIENVIDNLEALVLSIKNNGKNFLYYRQKEIIKHLTDKRYFGKYLEGGKIVIHGGGRHAASKITLPKGHEFEIDAAYLNKVFPLTRSKVYSIAASYMATVYLQTAHLDFDQLHQTGKGYREKVLNFKNLYKQGLVKANKTYYNSKITVADKVLVNLFYRHNNSSLLIKKVDTATCQKKLSLIDPAGAENILELQKYFDLYDSVIFVPKSKLVRVLKNKP